ncbi:transposase DNA-binding-containing protein [Agrobacterium sp. MS2]|uniref:transposase DNA-binding-containing protein n=1 Tax=Agrobacterium sp. MS2 TaxID=1345498 RepID=UPI001AECCDE8
MRWCFISVRDDVVADNDAHWSSHEIDAGAFRDARLGRRFSELLRRLREHVGGSIFSPARTRRTKSCVTLSLRSEC